MKHFCWIHARNIDSASKIIVVDTIENCLEVAMRMGADHVINPTKEDPVAAIKNLTNGKGAEFVVEGSGHPVALKQTQEAASWGSTVCVLGIHFQPTEIDFIELCKKMGLVTAGLSNCIYTKELISLIEKGRLD